MKKIIVFSVMMSFLLVGFNGFALAKQTNQKKYVQSSKEKDKNVKVKKMKKDKKHKGKIKKN